MNEFPQLLEPEISRLRRYARALTRDAGRADDLVQSCLLRALEKQHLWQPCTNLRVWLFTVLHNLYVSGIRQSLREQDRAGAAAAWGSVAQSEPGARLNLLDLDRAIGKLPPTQRQVLLLVGLEGVRYGDAAAIIGVPIGTIRSRVARARCTLRRILQGDAPTDHGERTSARTSSSVRRRGVQHSPHIAEAALAVLRLRPARRAPSAAE